MKKLQHLRTHPVLLILLILFIASTVYFWQGYQKEKTNKDFQVSVYKYFLAGLNPNNDVIGDNVDDYLPVQVYTPGNSFTEAEKEEITSKALLPFLSWEEENGKNVVAINVIRRSDNPAFFGKYTINYIENDGGGGAFSYGEASPLEWWVPTCEGSCEFSLEYETKFPEVVSQTQ